MGRRHGGELTPYCFGNVFSWVSGRVGLEGGQVVRKGRVCLLCFAGSYGYDLGADEGEDRIDEALEEAAEAAGVAGHEIFLHRARGLPIPKAKTVVVSEAMYQPFMRSVI